MAADTGYSLLPPMLFLLTKRYQEWLEAHDLGFLRVFTFVTFQSTVAILLAFSLVLLMAPRIIEWLRSQKIGACRPTVRSASIAAKPAALAASSPSAANSSCTRPSARPPPSAASSAA